MRGVGMTCPAGVEMSASLVIYTAPAVEPITLAEARAHLRLSSAPNFATGVADQTCALPATGSYILTITGAGSVAIAAGTAVGSGWATASAGTPRTVIISTIGTVTLDATGVVSTITLEPVLADDTIVSALITAAREMAENITRRAIITQTIDCRFDTFPAEILLPRPRLQTPLTSIKYLDTAGVEQTLSSASYRVDAYSEPARIRPEYGYSWPSTYSVNNAITIRYDAGYGLAASVPQVVKNAIKLELERLYTRDPRTNDTLIMARDMLLASERIFNEI